MGIVLYCFYIKIKNCGILNIIYFLYFFMKDKIFKLIELEEKRQKEKIGLIPSENHMSDDVRSVLCSVLSSKYSEGYPNARYYEGNQIIDKIEQLAIERVKKLFNVPYVNVQPYSGSPANSAIQFAILSNRDKLMGLKLSAGGHLTHGHPKVTFSGRFFRSIQFGLNAHSKIDLSFVRDMAKKYRPRMILIGTTSYPFKLDFKGFAQIADEIGAYLVADISHITGLVISGDHPSPFPYAHVVMSTTHKTFRGPRGAMIMVTNKGLSKDKKLPVKISKAIIPGLQGGPHNATIAGIALAAKEASTEEFKKYGHQIVANAKTLAQALLSYGIELVGGGTENHLMVMDLTNILGPGRGAEFSYAMDQAGLYANKNAVPNEKSKSLFFPSGVRIGTPLITTRGMKEKDMKKIALFIKKVLDIVKKRKVKNMPYKAYLEQFKTDIDNDLEIRAIREQVKEFASEFPLFTWS